MSVTDVSPIQFLPPTRQARLGTRRLSRAACSVVRGPCRVMRDAEIQSAACGRAAAGALRPSHLHRILADHDGMEGDSNTGSTPSTPAAISRARLPKA
jgi:hypothetical protein